MDCKIDSGGGVEALGSWLPQGARALQIGDSVGASFAGRMVKRQWSREGWHRGGQQLCDVRDRIAAAALVADRRVAGSVSKEGTASGRHSELRRETGEAAVVEAW